MDPRSSYYHSTRYATSHPPPPYTLPPPPHDNPILYNLPPPPSYPPPPFQTRFNLQFPVHQLVVSNPNHLPVREDYYPRLQHEHPGFSIARFPEFDYRDLPSFEQERFRQEVDLRSITPVVRIRSELDVNSRFLGDVNRRSEYSTRERGLMGYHRGRDQDPSLRDYRDSLHYDSSLRDLYPVDYERRSDLISDYGREGRRDVLNSMVEMGNQEFRDFDQYRIGYNSREANAGLDQQNDNGSRESSKGSREDSYEFNRTPKKKKSAFLRIQRAIVKNKDNQKMQYSGYYDADDSRRGKDPNSYAGRGTENKAGGGIPVELDVSFKSNSLVAKAVVTPPPASVSSSNVGLNPRNSKVRKLDISEKDSLSPQPMKPKRLATRLNSVVVKNVSSSGTDQEESKEKTTASTVFRNLDSSSMPVIGVTSKTNTVDGSGENNAADEGGCCLISGKKTLPKVAKKKKAIKIVVKKSEKASAGVSSSQPAKLPGKSMKVDFCDDGQLVASGSDASSISASVKAKGSDGLSNEGTMLPDHCLPMSSKCGNNLEIFEKDMLSDELNSEEKFVHDASVGMEVRLKDLPVMPENDKLKKSEDGLISEKPNTDENFLHEDSVGNGGSKLILDDRPVIPENYKFATLEQAMLSDKPDFDANSVHDASVGTSDADSHLCLESDQPVSNEHLVPDTADKICDSLLCLEKSKLETAQKDLISDHPNSGRNFGNDASIRDLRVPTIGRNLDNLQTHLCISGVPSSDDGHTNLGQHEVSFLLGKDVHRTSPQVSPSQELPHFDSSNLEKNEILKEPINSCNSNLRINGDDIYVQESALGSDLTVNNSFKRRFSELERASQENDQNQCSNVSSIARQCSELFSSLNSDSMGVEVATAATSAAFYNSVTTTVVSSGNSCSNRGIGGDIFKKSSPNDVAASVKNSTPRCVNDESSENEGVNSPKGEDCSRNSVKDLSLSVPEVTDMEHANRLSSAAWVDTTLRLSFKDSKEGSYVGLRSGTAEIDAVHPNTSVAISEANDMIVLDQTSPEKKRKLSPFELDLSFSIPSQVKDQDTSSHHDYNESGMSMEVSASAMGIFTSSECGPNRSNIDIKVSSITAHCTTDLLPENSGNSESSSGNSHHEHQIGTAEGCSGNDSIDLEIRNGGELEMEALEDQILTNDESAQSCLPSETLTAPDIRTGTYLVESNLPSATLVMSKGQPGNGLMDSEISNGHEMEIEAVEDRVPTDERVQDHLSEFQAPETLTAPDAEIDMYYLEGKNLPRISNCLPLSEALDDHLSKTLLYQNLTEKSAGGVGLPSEKSVIREGFNTSAPHNLCSQNTKIGVSSDQTVAGCRSILGRPPIPRPKDSLDIIPKLNGSSRQSYDKKNQSSPVVTRIQPHRPSFGLPASRNVSHLAQNTKRRTWHRNDSSTAPVLPGKEALSSVVPSQSAIPTQRQLPKNVAGSQSMSYVRKGNSLVRKPSPVAARSEGSLDSSTLRVRVNSSSSNALKDNMGSGYGAEGTNSLIERPRTPPLPIVPKVPHRTTNTLVHRVGSSVVESLNVSAGIVPDPSVCVETNDIPKSSDSQLRNPEAPVTGTPNEASEGRVEPSGVNITYVKRKSNQLVATSSLSSVSAHGPCNNQPSSSKSYYKRSKNQLVRTSLDGCNKPGFGNADDSSKAEGHSTQGMKSSGNLGRRQLLQGVTKIRKPKGCSLVWTLSGAQSSKDVGQSLHRQRILPNLFPWKRATYRRNTLPSSISSSIISSIISKKFFPLRTHDTVYTRSKHGFSLVKSKVVSVGGSSLKWSKSIQSRSKKVNEEATLAVAAADKKKREQNGARPPVSGTKNKNSPPRGRIFRIGSVRYKMDPSRRTLYRISDEALPSADIPQTEKDAKKPYVPRRLTIGKDEYVRIGNGNKLIRNPKKRSRILASEKVRWSLHTARSRLAKKRKYCQFFTRFGNCNKDDGKCPYIHDPSKVAVCTKFLHGLCSNDDCKLTHKVIPERMPDCSFYLQGLCTNKHCSYRHVHVNPKAPACEGFLKGYCADGNECRKKHSYLCPSYEATGSCPQGSKCKLHHPKNRGKGNKRKPLQEKNHVQGRYFAGLHFSSPLPKSGTSAPERVVSGGNEGDDFISLGISDKEDAARGEEESPSKLRVVDEQLDLSDGESLEDSEFSDLDKLIMPVRIMNI